MDDLTRVALKWPQPVVAEGKLFNLLALQAETLAFAECPPEEIAKAVFDRLGQYGESDGEEAVQRACAVAFAMLAQMVAEGVRFQPKCPYGS